MPTEDPRPSRAMQIVSVRFGALQLSDIAREAEVEGISTSQFIREAAYARALVTRARRGDALHEVSVAFLELVQEVGSDAAHTTLEGALAKLQQARVDFGPRELQAEG